MWSVALAWFFCYNYWNYFLWLSAFFLYFMGRSELQKLLEHKRNVKEKIFAKCWPGVKHKIPLIPLLIIFAKNGKKERDLLFKLLEGLLMINIVVIVVSENDEPDHLRHLGGKISWINFENRENMKNGCNAGEIAELLDAADAAIIFDEKQSTLHALFQKGIVPIACEKSPLVSNYEPLEESGNSFTFHSLNPWDIFAAIVRAMETYHFPYDWQHILRRILKVR